MSMPSEPYRIHGGPCDDELRALAIEPRELLDFSVNLNPYGPCRGVVEAVRTAPIDRYPDPTARAAREIMSRALGVSVDEIALGNGAAELLWTIARALLRPRASALVVEPTFCEFRAAAVATGAHVFEWRATRDAEFAIDLAEIAASIEQKRPDVVYLCTPNTPTASALPVAEIVAWAKAMPHVTVVLDQSFLSLSHRFQDAAVPVPPNVIRIRSLTKEHAIPGVRIGYLIASEELVRHVEWHRPAWMTSTIAQAAAVAACREASFVDESRRKILLDRERLSATIERLGYRVFRSTTVFFLVAVDNAKELRRRLLVRHQILVRDCASFGLPGFIRIAARPERDCERLVIALEEESRR